MKTNGASCRQRAASAALYLAAGAGGGEREAEASVELRLDGRRVLTLPVVLTLLHTLHGRRVLQRRAVCCCCCYRRRASSPRRASSAAAAGCRGGGGGRGGGGLAEPASERGGPGAEVPEVVHERAVLAQDHETNRLLLGWLRRRRRRRRCGGEAAAYVGEPPQHVAVRKTAWFLCQFILAATGNARGITRIQGRPERANKAAPAKGCERAMPRRRGRAECRSANVVRPRTRMSSAMGS